MKKINFEVLLKTIILSGFILLFSKIINSEEIALYVHPRIVPFIKVSIAAMGLITLVLFSEIFKKNRVKRRMTAYILFFIPIIIAITIGAEPMTSESTREGSISINGDINGASVLYIQGKETIVIDSSNFIEFLNDSNKNINNYLNKKIQIEGFVYKDSTLNKDQFAVGRFMMTCCTADMSIVGIICDTNLASKYDKDTWVQVSGTLEKGRINGEVLAVIKVDKVDRVQAPKNQYVYPY